MALNTLPAGAFADDAITSDKINLANTFAFTGTVTGTPNNLVKIAQQVISSNIIEFEFQSSISDTYTRYLLTGTGVRKDVSNAIRLQYMSGSSVLNATQYDFAYGVGMRSRSSTTWSNRDSNVQYIQIAEGCGTQTASIACYIDTTGRTSGAAYVPTYGTVTHWKDNSNGQVITNQTGIYFGSTTIDGIKVFCQSDNFTAGTFTLYGVKQ